MVSGFTLSIYRIRIFPSPLESKKGELLRLRFCSLTRSLSCSGNTSWRRPSNHCPVKTVVGLLVATSGIHPRRRADDKTAVDSIHRAPQKGSSWNPGFRHWPFSESELLAYPFLGDLDA